MLQRKESRHEPDASDEGTVEEQGVMAKYEEDGGAEGREGLVPEGTGWGRCGDQKGRPSSPEKRGKALNPEPHCVRWWSTETPQGNNLGRRDPESPASPGAVTSSQYLLLDNEWLPAHIFKEIWSSFIYFYI